jgi:hypothetical protein
VFGFLCGDHGQMTFASLCLILIPQTPDLVLDLTISGGTLAFWLSSFRDQFPMF